MITLYQFHRNVLEQPSRGKLKPSETAAPASKIPSKSPVASAAKPGATLKTSAFATSFFTRLKKEERHFSRRRIRLGYEENLTGSLSLPYSTAVLSEKHADISSLISMSEQYIIEHASRRVDLFFYTLIAYYNTNVIPVEGHTNLQHGKGRTLADETNLTQACHSSFTPSLIDKTMDIKTGKRCLLSGTHLFESLNSTVELPSLVNNFDDILEAICRPKCIEILQKVAAGELNPIQGLNNFLVMMDTLLRDFESQAKSKKYSGLSHAIFSSPTAYVSLKLIELVSRGTLRTTFVEDSGVASKDYVQLSLWMTPEEKAACNSSVKKNAKIYVGKFVELQKEILSSASIEYSLSATSP